MMHRPHDNNELYSKSSKDDCLKNISTSVLLVGATEVDAVSSCYGKMAGRNTLQAEHCIAETNWGHENLVN